MPKSIDHARKGQDLSRLVDLLSSAALFASFSGDELLAIAEKSALLSYVDGEVIFEPGQEGNGLFQVVSGSVVVSSPADGSVIAEFVEKDTFGELELLTRSKRNASARAQGPTTLLAFPAGGSGLETALKDSPIVAGRILRSFLLVVAGRTRKANALVKENSPWVRELSRQVYGDKLTGLLNRAWLEEKLPGLLTPPFALIMLKPDNFKELNDRFGHEVGDAALVMASNELGRIADGEGTALRYQGNELAIAYPQKDRTEALAAARSIQARLSSLDLGALTKDPAFRLRVSLGIAIYPEHGATAEDLIKACSGLPLLARERGGSLILFPEDAQP